MLAAVLAVAVLGAFAAGASLKDARPYDPGSAREALTDAQAARTRFDWDSAIESYTRSIWLDPGRAEAYYGRGLIRATTGDPGAASRDFRTALALNPAYDEARLSRAGARVQLGNLEGAIDDVRAIVKRKPDDPTVHLQMGAVLTLTGDRAATNAEYLLAASLYESHGATTLAQSARRLASDGSQASAPAVRPAPQIADVVTAERLLFSQYVDQPSYQALISSAWQGARSLAQARGVSVPLDLGPVFGNSQTTAEDGLRRALQSLAGLSAGKVDTADLILEAIDAMARSLDDNHTVFARPTSVLREAGRSYGLGVYGIRDGTGGTLVRDVASGSPADLGGLRPGDIVRGRDFPLNVDDSNLSPAPILVVVDRMGKAEFEVMITPGSFPIPLISYGLLDSGIGYVKISGFPGPLESMPGGATFLEFLDEGLRDLKSQGAARWVLDLRGNAGGLSVTAAAVEGRFGGKGVLSEARFRQDQVRLDSAFGPAIVRREPLAVLVDNQSLSMAEVLAGALQDSGRARVFGTATGGKVNGATIQLVAGGALEITIARIRSGPGRLELDEAGLVPAETIPLDRRDLAAGKDTQLDAAVRYLLGGRIH